MSEASFGAETLSVRAARSFVASVLKVPEEMQENVALLVSELAANSVLHARTPFQVEVTETFGRLRVAVTDASPRMPVIKRYGLDATTGRGLRLIQALADRWGVESEAHGKTVWFEFDLADPEVRRSA